MALDRVARQFARDRLGRRRRRAALPSEERAGRRRADRRARRVQGPAIGLDDGPRRPRRRLAPGLRGRDEWGRDPERLRFPGPEAFGGLIISGVSSNWCAYAGGCGDVRRAGLGRAAGLISNQYRHDSEFRHDHAQQLPEALSFFGLRLRSFQSFDRFDRHRLDLARFAVQSECKRTEPVLSRPCRDYTRGMPLMRGMLSGYFIVTLRIRPTPRPRQNRASPARRVHGHAVSGP